MDRIGPTILSLSKDAPLDLSDDGEFTALRRDLALGGLLELLELAPPESSIGTEALAALLGALLEPG